jgi:hypothetical protein
VSQPQRMRVRHGRVMHVVEEAGSGLLRSRCKMPHPVLGAGVMVARVSAPAGEWSPERHWYPDCSRCPAESR